ncbi:hypothetical protein SS50377_20528 [Spironucleus salmonicida]|uniref:Uncharacterized protein n=1 Tax=Spironucleus salmonicida TaxID=348837 RepID=V6LHN9_9EUKA|nr:hypothetical protein SS50377_20528 [Spironucleus salmonicida]|eukprot:EST43818.1 Hypothetical protein SS50377_16439 [Spironucleus salmonicida]
MHPYFARQQTILKPVEPRMLRKTQSLNTQHQTFISQYVKSISPKLLKFSTIPSFKDALLDNSSSERCFVPQRSLCLNSRPVLSISSRGDFAERISNEMYLKQRQADEHFQKVSKIKKAVVLTALAHEVVVQIKNLRLEVVKELKMIQRLKGAQEQQRQDILCYFDF